MADQKITLFFENAAGERAFSTNNGTLRAIFAQANVEAPEPAFDLLKSKDPVVSIVFTAPDDAVNRVAKAASGYENVAVARGELTNDNVREVFSKKDMIKLAVWTM